MMAPICRDCALSPTPTPPDGTGGIGSGVMVLARMSTGHGAGFVSWPPWAAPSCTIDHRDGVATVPRQVPLPKLLARALALCSGEAPRLVPGTGIGLRAYPFGATPGIRGRSSQTAPGSAPAFAWRGRRGRREGPSRSVQTHHRQRHLLHRDRLRHEVPQSRSRTPCSPATTRCAEPGTLDRASTPV